MTLTQEIALHLRITGKVQGVGYRYTAWGEACAQGLRGWVRNRDDDGSVEAVICGPDAAIQAFLRWAHQGPPHARVDRVAQTPAPLLAPDAGFEVLPSVP